MGNITRKSFLEAAGALAGATLLAGCGNSTVGQTTEDTGAADAAKAVYDMTTDEEDEAIKKEPAYGTTLQVGYTGGICLGAFGICDVKGFAKDEGLDCQLVSGTAAVDGLGSGKLQIGGTHIASLLVPAYNGMGITMTLGLQSGCKSLYVLTDGGIEATSDLKGQTIAIPEGVGGADHHIAMRFLSRDGIDPTKDVTFKQVEKEACVQAMQNGEVQAAILEDQYAAQFVKQNIIKYIRSLTYDDDFKVEPCCILAFNSDFAEKNPVHVKKYTRAMQKAADWIDANPEEALDVMFENNWATGDRQDDLDLIEAFDYTISEQQTKDALIQIITDYQKFGILDDSQTPDEVLAKVWTPVLGAVD